MKGKQQNKQKKGSGDGWEKEADVAGGDLFDDTLLVALCTRTNILWGIMKEKMYWLWSLFLSSSIYDLRFMKCFCSPVDPLWVDDCIAHQYTYLHHLQPMNGVNKKQ